MLTKFVAIELNMGRVRSVHWGPRLIDIDILFYGNLIFKSELLTIPHPELQNRKFVLVPLNEIAPQLMHPVLKKTIAQLINSCPDKLEIVDQNKFIQEYYKLKIDSEKRMLTTDILQLKEILVLEKRHWQKNCLKD